MLSLKKLIPYPANKDARPPPFNWLMFILLIALPFIVIPSFIVTVSLYGSWVYYGVMFVITYALCILSIGIYHRFWTHRSFEFKDNILGKLTNVSVRVFGVIFGSLAGQGDAISWVLRHWKHHLVEDMVGKDHHTPLEFKSKFLGFLWSHVGWMCYLDTNEFDYASHSSSKRQELEKDKLLCWQRKYYGILYSFFALAFPVIIACLLSSDFWYMLSGDTFSSSALMIHITLTFLTINAARMTCQHATFLVNSLCHISGSKPYQNHKTGEAKDNWFVAVLVFGEGFHNGHHAFGYSYEHGLISTQNKKTWRANLMYFLDIHARIIDVFDALGLLKFKLKPSDSEIAMVMQKKILFDLEHTFEKLSLEFSQKKVAFHQHLSQEIDILKAKMSEISDEYYIALEILISKLQKVIETCKEKVKFYSQRSCELTSIWQDKLQKAEKELKHFQLQLQTIQTA
jgi:stearoyl-CoA desaturase (delta-9 desaturase)